MKFVHKWSYFGGGVSELHRKRKIQVEKAYKNFFTEEKKDMRPGEAEVLVLEKCLKNNKKTRNKDIIEHCNKGNRTKGGRYRRSERLLENIIGRNRKWKRWDGID